MKHIFVLFVLFVIQYACQAADDFVWWEGEAAAKHNFTNKDFNPAWYGAKRDGLSNRDWLHTGGKRGKDEAFAEYEIEVPAAADYSLWTRKFWQHGPFRWRFDEGEWQTCGRDCALADSFTLATHISANWVSLGKVNLAKGKHRFELRLLAKEGEDAVACFDCFLLTPRAFMPNGALKPGQKSGKAAPGWWAFEPPADPFSADAKLNLRSLNEKIAGESGFVQADGMKFKLGNGQPARFWAVNCGPGQVNLSREQADYLAARLAKCGVNMVRIHGAVFQQGAADPTQINEKYLDNLHYFVAALKKQGVYSLLSFYFPLWFDVKASYGIEGYDKTGNKKPFSLLYFDPRMQEIYKQWAAKLLTAKNPYTGVPLGKEPAVGIVEIINEDSYFFWTFSEQNIPPPQMAKLEKRFGAWLAKKHGSVEQALAAWPGTKHPRDNAAAGQAGLFEAWHMTADGAKAGGPDKSKRMSNQVRFLTEDQRAFYAEMKRYFREDLGARNLIAAGNWQTADERTLGALERYSYTACDVIDRHNAYYGGEHKGPRAAYAVSDGDTLKHRAGAADPGAAPLPYIQYDGFPHIISEIGWTNPNRFRADNTFLASAYGSLQGVAGFFFFAVNSPAWSAGVDKFPVSVPSVLGQFPAAALAYRRGDVKESATIIHQVLNLEDLFALKGSGAAEAQNLDALRAANIPLGGAASGKTVNSIDPFAGYVGRVSRSFGADTSKSLLTDLSPFIDRAKKTIKSSTGELNWNYDTGVVTMDSPRSQGAAGYLAKAGAIKLKDVVIESKNEYAAIHCVSLDGEPLAQSKKILIQAFTEEQTFGWKVDDKGKILDLGSPPMNVKNIEATVTLLAGGKAKATALDEHGYARTGVEFKESGGALIISLPADALYTVVER